MITVNIQWGYDIAIELHRFHLKEECSVYQSKMKWTLLIEYENTIMEIYNMIMVTYKIK